MSHGKQFTLYAHKLAPNPWSVFLCCFGEYALTMIYYRKVVCVLLELGLTYESIYLEFENNGTKIPEHIKYNPNGRVPTLIDHHAGDFVVW